MAEGQASRGPRPILLGFELDFASEQPSDLRGELMQAAELRRTVEARLANGPRINKPDLTRRAAETLVAVVAKNYKTFRSVEILTTIGWESEASALARGLFEACVLCRFLTAGDLDRRTAMLWAHLNADQARQVETAITYGVIFGEDEIASARAFAAEAKARQFDLPPATPVVHHWSGNPKKLRGVCEDLKIGSWYAAIQGRLSYSVHGLDFQHHIEARPDQRPEIQYGPSRRESAIVLSFARFFFADLVETVFAAFGDSIDLKRFKPALFGDAGPASGR